MEGLSDQELLEEWDSERDMDARDALYKEIARRRLFPKEEMATWEAEAGLYPDADDPRFIEKLMTKQEFAENLQESFGVQQKKGANPCDSQEEFELTPVQRFVSRFMSPQCPYNSALLYHGVGVGKTCAAITTAENYLRSYPHSPVFIIAPRTIQSGFRRTIYDENDLRLGTEETEPNTLRGCTGSSYLRKAGVEFERDKGLITRRVNQAISSRYKILGYIQFYRYIRDLLDKIPKTISAERREQEEFKVLRQEFSGRMVIIDEAHNLRDAPGETADDAADAAGGETEVAESKAGKRLTPLLMRVLQAADGMKLLLLTGTPMYNSYREIVFILNLLLMNDKKATLSERDIFLPNGKFRPLGAKRLGAAAAAYLSFMRGENPLSFPVRLPPMNVPSLAAWPRKTPVGEAVAETLGPMLLRLPFVPVSFDGVAGALQKAEADRLTTGGLGVQVTDQLVQMGNWLFPGEDVETRIRVTGFDNTFDEVKGATLNQFRAEGDAAWLAKERIDSVSPKAAFILNRIPSARGAIFIYSRFIKSGAVPLAIALEANGYTPWGRETPLFTNGIVDGRGRQCALCSARERMHIGKGHKFTPARYVLLTGQAAYSPNNAAAIAASRAPTNMDGREIKVVIGSQVASEGIDLRFIREIYVFDSWFHLNKMEQVLGRGVRTCSHSLLPPVQRNCTIHLLLHSYGPESDTETADEFMYRTAMIKALQVGQVTRVLKRYALDCNLNAAAVQATDLEPLERQEDSQGAIRENVPLNDTPFSSLCDWMECPYTCAKPVDVASILQGNRVDLSTYDEYAMRWRETQVKQILKNIFEKEEQPMIQIDSLIEAMRAGGVPEMAIRTLLADIVGKQSFRLRIGGQEGYIVYRNTYYVFQPLALADVRIPLAMRIADVPVRKDFYEPGAIKVAAAPAPAPAPAEAPAATNAANAHAPAITTATSTEYWAATVAWAESIEAGTSDLDIPVAVQTAIERRYAEDEYKREFNILVMISWMYEDILRNPEYEAKRKIWLQVLSQTLLEMVWDGSLKRAEQLALLAEGGTAAVAAATEQRVKKGSTEATRFVNPATGTIDYICADGAKCSDAVSRLFEADKSDPLNGIKADRTTAGRIYGMILPKVKEGTLVFKTNDRPVDPGVPPEKGGECEIVSSIGTHKRGLRDIREMMMALGYPAFLLREEVLEEKEERKKVETKKKKKGEGETEFQRLQTRLRLDSRKFQNVVKACALKQIILRFLDIAERGRPGAKKYFYRPVAAIKAKHKLK